MKEKLWKFTFTSVQCGYRSLHGTHPSDIEIRPIRTVAYPWQTVTGMSFLDMLEQWLLPQLTEDSNNFLLQIDGAPPHCI